MNKKELVKESLTRNLKNKYAKDINNATDFEIYDSLVLALKELIIDNYMKTKETYKNQKSKQIYYLSIEFMIGRSLGNNLINMGLDKDIKSLFEELNIDINKIENIEDDPAIANGGLGRLSACFLDSLATMSMPGHGASIKYKHGLFKQSFSSGYQIENPDEWLKTGESWLIKQDEDSVTIKFGQDEYIKAVPYDMPITGYKNNTVNSLRLWDAVPINNIDLNSFNQGNYIQAFKEKINVEAITSVLYPDDSTIEGKKLRLKQEYFFTSATIQTVLKKFIEENNDFKLLPEKVQFQLNDTHPAVAIAELIRVLIDTYNLTFDDAMDLVNKTCSYTNHTILSEALECWEVGLFKELLPRVYEIIEELNIRFCGMLMGKNYPGEKIAKLSIIDGNRIKMAHLAIVGGHSVNGVARLHTEILKNQELKDFYELYPEKFNNKTNGITQRRWLLKSNPELAQLITDKIGDEWITNLSELKKLEQFIDDKDFKQAIYQIKYNNKVKLAEYILKNTGITVNPKSIFDVQIKRLHLYKRQLLNIMQIMNLYNKLKENPEIDIEPRTFIFASKSASSYRMAKLVIKLINTVADKINNDKTIKDKIKVIFLPNYNVTLAENIIPASDISEQISTASKEASGTGNMKLMLNGAITIGTMDGANIEIFEEAGIENEFVFGLSSKEVINYEKNGGYIPKNFYDSDEDLKRVLDQLIDGSLDDNKELFRDIYNELMYKDQYFLLADFKSYIESQAQVDKLYKDKDLWTRMTIMNIANSGKFSSDNIIKQYAEDIWGISKIII